MVYPVQWLRSDIGTYTINLSASIRKREKIHQCVQMNALATSLWILSNISSQRDWYICLVSHLMNSTKWLFTSVSPICVWTACHIIMIDECVADRNCFSSQISFAVERKNKAEEIWRLSLAYLQEGWLLRHQYANVKGGGGTVVDLFIKCFVHTAPRTADRLLVVQRVINILRW